MADSIPSDPPWAREFTNTTDVPWYLADIDNKLTPATRHLLETYSNIPPEEVLPHVRAIRDKAWSVLSYMCVGLGRFLDPTITQSPNYATILERLKQGATLVDVGCFVGQDLRRVVVDGAPTTNLYAIDLVDSWDIGYELFRDRDKFQVHYITADILRPNPALKELDGKMDIIWVTHLLHQWTWEGQVVAAKTLVALSRPGTTVAGFQIGATVATHVAPTKLMNAESFLHDPTSFAKMWDQVGEETGTKWHTQAQFKSLSEMGWDPEDLPRNRVLQFVVDRVG